ncbi:hypothetical protein Golax_011049 [Gossypium laxum]|uniref:Uncharacterized protein n=1 Tax=Gossypium laxum TaxID=34288 RepID=A0A7J8ZJG3_9ROSI|nr:hypothetical protein [Gossypium laxum]
MLWWDPHRQKKIMVSLIMIE